MPSSADRPRLQSALGLGALFRPRGVAVVGASRDKGGIGRRILDNILAGGFPGNVYPINKKAKRIAGLRAYPSLLEAPSPIDLVIIAVPARAVPAIVRESSKKKVKAIVVISAGFRETGAEGARIEADLGRFVRDNGMRMVGPNCMGIVNGAVDARLNATFAPVLPPAGTTALMTQSGALGVALLQHATDLRLGVARFVSMGNKTDVSGNDLLLLWEDDPEVRTILMYIENFGNPRNFVKIARRVGRKKPILVVKSGRTGRGAKAASSHTGALAETEHLVNALFEQCGVLRVNTVEELFDVALALAFQPLPRGGRVAIVTNSGGPAILAVDAMEGTGLELAPIAPKTWEKCRAAIPAQAARANPLDLLAGGDPAAYEATLSALLSDPNVDAGIVICTPILGGEEALADAIIRAARTQPRKPLLAVFFGRATDSPGFVRLSKARIPVYSYPENAVRALVAGNRIAENRKRPRGKTPVAPRSATKVRAVLKQAREQGRTWLRQDQALAILQRYGIPVAPFAFARTAQEAAAQGKKIGFPVVLKIEDATVVHKTEIQGVQLGLADRAAVIKAAYAMRNRLGREPEGFLVMKQIDKGRELLLGATQDARFGPAIALGLGGIYAEVLKDVVFRLAPLTDVEAGRMWRALRGRALLEGVRAEEPGDVAALERALLSLSLLAHEHPEIEELDINPFILSAKTGGSFAVDARIRIGERHG